ncbi:hypothetical protein MXB_1832 [Myxobolus squamalis]|nr:hypothetical protein MXB_1832 [Myxobolus squamalis]
MSLNKKIKILKSKSKLNENWKKVYKYFTRCMWKLKNCLNPDSTASDYNIRFEILKIFSKTPRKTIHDIYHSIVDADFDKIWFDLHHGFLYSKQDCESLKFDKSINIIDTIDN